MKLIDYLASISFILYHRRKSMKLDLVREFGELVRCAKAELTYEKGITQIKYPYSKISDNYEWNSAAIDKILQNGANIYALWTMDDNTHWHLVYVGQRKSKEIRSRLIQHLFKKSEKTGSQLQNISEAVSQKLKIGISTILVEPDELRTSVEERLITEFKSLGLCKWNIHS